MDHHQPYKAGHGPEPEAGQRRTDTGEDNQRLATELIGQDASGEITDKVDDTISGHDQP